jgi:hypothetical protein
MSGPQGRQAMDAVGVDAFLGSGIDRVAREDSTWMKGRQYKI